MQASYFHLNRQDRILSIWLSINIILVLIILIIGGLTRLENAGLSIVEWDLIVGVIPPFTENAWLIEFAKYQTSPEYNLINHHISLAEFKYIFKLEYIHRIAGRLLGLIFALPYLYMLLKGVIRKKLAIKLGIILSLIAFQGLLGWFMVQSGLVKEPHVSHFRLASHLVTALIIYSLMVLLLFEIYYTKSFTNIPLNSLSLMALALIIFIFIQITLGALVAGLNAGMLYNEFPYMGTGFIPLETLKIGWDVVLFSDPASIQFFHRCWAYILSLYIIFFLLYTRNISPICNIIPAKSLLSALVLQFMLGIAVLLMVTPTYLALLHQLFAVFLLTCSLYIYFILRASDFNKKITT